MSSESTDRRRHRRIPVSRDLPDTTLPVSATVQVLDISETGVLLASTQPLGVGRRAHLRTRLGSEPLAVQVEIKRLLPSLKHTRTAYRMGAAFVELDEDTRRKLETFLKGQT